MSGIGEEGYNRLPAVVESSAAAAAAAAAAPEGEEAVVDAELFHCSICLDMVYKPIVQSCGHIFCFWCIHKSMNARKQSRCPVCRRPYSHFRRICEVLHFLLMRTAPEEYSRRAQEIRDMEQVDMIFSPCIQLSPRSLPRPLKETHSERFNDQQSGNISPPEFEVEVIQKGEKDDKQVKGHRDLCRLESVLTVEDFLCASCNKFLYRPVVLDCGQVLCESCVKTSGPLLSCPVCRDSHPGGSVQVCLELHYYLKRTFAAKYLKRKDEVSLQPLSLESKTVDMGEDPAEMGKDLWNHEDDLPKPQFVHAYVGCDGCGMYPIVGDRYKCTDCAEKVGYDLCGNCHRKGTTIHGRFNQQHKQDHHVQVVEPDLAEPVNLATLMFGSVIIQRLHRQLPPDSFNDFVTGLM